MAEAFEELGRRVSRGLRTEGGNTVLAFDGAADGEALIRSGDTISSAAIPAPGGAGGAVQYNNGGAFAGSTNLSIVGADILSHAREDEHLIIPTPGVASSGYGASFMAESANRALWGIRGSEGPATLCQPSIFGRRISQFYAGSSSTMQSLGHWSASAQGTGARLSFDTTSTTRFRNSVRLRYLSAAAINSAAGVLSGQTVAWRGNSSGLGGFFLWMRFGWEAAPASDCRVFVGLSATGTTQTVTTNISGVTLVNAIGIGKNSNETNYQLILKDAAGAYASTDLGVAPAINDLIDLYLWAPPNSAYVNARVFDVNSGSDLYASAAIGAGLPADNALFYSHCLASTGPTSTTAIQFCPIYGYLEQDL